MDAAEKNLAKYKAGFTNKATKKDFVKVSPLKIVPGISQEQMNALGLKQGPKIPMTNPHKG